MRRVHETTVAVEKQLLHEHARVGECMRPRTGGRAQACACAHVALLMQHVTRRHIVICDPSGSTKFSQFSQTARISGKSY